MALFLRGARFSSILLNQSQSSTFLGTRSFATGTTKWFNVKKGFGFIKPDVEGEPDLFVHQTAIQASGFRFLNEAEKVTYDVERTDKGPQAANVRDATGKPFARPYTNPNPSFQGGDNDGAAAGGGGGLSSPRERRTSNSVGNNSIGGTGAAPVEARPNWSDSPSATSSGAPSASSSPSTTRPAARPRTPRTTSSPAASASSQSVSSAPVKE